MAKGIKVKLDRKRHLLITADGLAAYERVTGRSLLARSTMRNLCAGDIVVMGWSFLIYEDPELEIQQVADMISSERNWDNLLNGIERAWDAYMKELDQ